MVNKEVSYSNRINQFEFNLLNRIV